MPGLSIWLSPTTRSMPGFEKFDAIPRSKPTSYHLNGTLIEHDEEGFITDIGLWSTALADLIAVAEDIEMSDDHWEVVNFLREYYQEYQIAPAVRVLTKAIKRSLGPEKGNAQYLYELFPYGPAKQACKIAGLPKPTGCV